MPRKHKRQEIQILMYWIKQRKLVETEKVSQVSSCTARCVKKYTAIIAFMLSTLHFQKASN